MTRRITFKELVSNDSVDAVTEVARRRKIPQAGCLSFERVTWCLTSFPEPVTGYVLIRTRGKVGVQHCHCRLECILASLGRLLRGKWLAGLVLQRCCITLAVLRRPGHLAEWLFRSQLVVTGSFQEIQEPPLPQLLRDRRLSRRWQERGRRYGRIERHDC